MNEPPLFRHKCAECTYLGRYVDVERTVDLWHCTQGAGGAWSTVIARWSDDEQAYTSGLALAPRFRALAEAERRAKERGLL